MSRNKIIVNLGGRGDIINTTMFPKLYKENGYDQVIWITFRKNLDLLRGNPYIDKIVAAEDISKNAYIADSNHHVASMILKKQFQESGYDCQFPAPYCHPEYDGGTSVSLLQYIRKSLISEFNLTEEEAQKQIPMLFLTEEEKNEAQQFFSQLPTDRKIVLVEHESFSGQTFVGTEELLVLARKLRADNPKLFFVFSGFRKLAEEGIVSYNGSYKSNCELYNLCDGFVSICSGISCLVYSNCCPQDKPTLEISRGRHWSSYDYTHKKNRQFVTNPNDIPLASEILMRKINEG